MKIIFLVSLVSAAVHAFVPGQMTTQHTTTTTMAAAKNKFEMGFFEKMFQPIHGHGTGETRLGEIYKAEQELLKERQHHYRKEQLKEKYAARVANNKNWFDNVLSHPFHMHGSAAGEKDHDEMFKVQQQVLYERREYYGNKDMLRKKYHNNSPSRINHLNDIPVHKFDPRVLNKKEDDAMYVDDSAKGFQFPFFKTKVNPKLKP
jgi:hypothetical protein